MTNLPAPGTYDIDAGHSYVGFAVKHFGLSTVKGEFQKFAGSITIAPEPTASSVSVTIDASSFNSRDEQRDTHVRSADFLDVENHPGLSFTSTGVRRDGDAGSSPATSRPDPPSPRRGPHRHRMSVRTPMARPVPRRELRWQCND